MDRLEQLFKYCERGTDTSVWAEPLNAVTTSFLVLVGVWLWVLVRTQGLVYQRPTIQYVLALLVILIGLSSFGLHTQVTAVDFGLMMISTGVFGTLYLYLALTRFLQVKHRWALISTFVFGILWTALTLIPCLFNYCLPSTSLYVPPVVALMVVAQRLHQRNHPATRWLGGSCVLLVSGLIFHGMDQPLCQGTLTESGYYLGWHFLWHVLSGIALFVLVQAMIQFYRYAALSKT
ncbi:MAG: hypothetical protein RLZZ422_2170 [Pseudomonadota bacterium]|jgi:hypothetical protein